MTLVLTNFDFMWIQLINACLHTAFQLQSGALSAVVVALVYYNTNFVRFLG